MNLIRTSLLLFFLIVSGPSAGQDELSRFNHLNAESGLSQSSVTCILKDSRGFMWFGTEDGLNKYDGTEFTVYRHQPDDVQSISSSYIHTILEDTDGFLWIGTKNGLNYFNPLEETFSRPLTDLTPTTDLGTQELHSIIKLDQETLLVGSSAGLFFFNQKTESLNQNAVNHKTRNPVICIVQDTQDHIWVLRPDLLERFKYNGESLELLQTKSLEHSGYYTLFPDTDSIWIGTNDGLLKLHPDSGEKEIFKFYPSTSDFERKNTVISIAPLNEEELLLGTLEGGLIRFNKQTSAYTIIRHIPFNRTGLSSNSIKSIYLDPQHILWVGTFGGGINKYDPNQIEFEHYFYSPENLISLSENTVRAVLKDRDDELWVGTHDGLNRINRKNGSILVYKHHPENHSSVSSNTVRALKEDTEGGIWVGTWSNGLNRFDKSTGTFKRYVDVPGSQDSITEVRALEVDRQNKLWIGGNGLRSFDLQTAQFLQYSLLDHPSEVQINSLFMDEKDRLWIGTTQHGLYNLDIRTGIHKNFVPIKGDSTSLSHPYITSIAKGKDGGLWIGTYGGGLNRFSDADSTFKRYNVGNGLLNDVVYGVATDNLGSIWFSTNAGLSRFEPEQEEFMHFGPEYGIQSEEFNAGAYSKSEDGELFFGGINGLNAFKPDKINQRRTTSELVFTGFELLDENSTHITPIPADRHISRVDTLRLTHDQNNFSLKFSELNYANNVHNSYEYFIDGLHSEWQNLGQQKMIHLANLPTKTHLLSVRIKEDKNKQASLTIIIAPPIWRSNGAYVLYVFMFIGSFGAAYKYVRKIQGIQQRFEVRIKSLENDIKLSAQVHESTTRSSIPLKQEVIERKDQKFLKRAIEIVEENMENSGFDVQEFADEMFMSRSQLYRKLKSLTGHSTTKFIRLIRLKRAAQLLANNADSVAEIAYQVGFENVGYFSKCFHETFGKPPSQYKI